MSSSQDRVSRLMRYFEYKHLPESLQAASKPFCEVANAIFERRESCHDLMQVEIALTHLLVAKDALVRSNIPPS